MTKSSAAAPELDVSSAWKRIGLLFAGIVITCAILYGPSLLGRKIMLPLDVLAMERVYLPRTPEVAAMTPENFVASDMVYSYEPQRRFIHSEVAAGRLPLWMPYQYAGVPNIWPWFSPTLALAWSVASPKIWAWVHLCSALIAGAGAYWFLRRSLKVSYGPALVLAWCYPLTGFLVLWQGHLVSGAIIWFPWLLGTVDRVVEDLGWRSMAWMAAAVLMVLIGGGLDVSGQCLLVSGIYGVWRVFEHRLRPAVRSWKALVLLTLGWGFGIMLAAPHWLNVVSYTRTGARMANRASGTEERPPVGLSALPLTVLPDMNGSLHRGSLYLGGVNEMESASAFYAGVIVTLFAAPLAWCSRRNRAFFWFAVGMIVLSLAWCLDLPGFVFLLRLPGLNMMSHNRLVFAGSFFVICLAAIGLDVLWDGAEVRRRWFWIPAALTILLGIWCACRAIVPQEPIATQIGTAVQQGHAVRWVRTAADVAQVQQWYRRAWVAATVSFAFAIVAWAWFLRGGRWPFPLRAALVAVMVGDLTYFAFGRTSQCDPSLYYPPLPVFEELAKKPPGRIAGIGCLPPNLALTAGFNDVRGYDGVDPKEMVELIHSAIEPGSPVAPYTATQWVSLHLEAKLPGTLLAPPVLNLIGLRYAIFRGAPPAQLKPQFQSFDYWVMENPGVLPRVFVPRAVESVKDHDARLRRLSAREFDPHALALVEEPLPLSGGLTGTAEITTEVPTRVTVTARMQTPGLVVLADRWDRGWHAYREGKQVPLLRVDHALRGVVAPAGETKFELRYEPDGLRMGVGLAGLALLGLVGGLAWSARRPKDVAVPRAAPVG